MIHRSVMLEDQKLPSSRIACLQVEPLLYRIYTVTYKLRFTELVSDVKGQIKPRLSKHSWITSKENLALRRLMKCQSSVPYTAHSWEQAPVLSLPPPSTRHTYFSSFQLLCCVLSLVVSRLVCSVEITNARISCFPELWGALSLQMLIRGDNPCWRVVPVLLFEGWLCSVMLAEGES